MDFCLSISTNWLTERKIVNKLINWSDDSYSPVNVYGWHSSPIDGSWCYVHNFRILLRGRFRHLRNESPTCVLTHTVSEAYEVRVWGLEVVLQNFARENPWPGKFGCSGLLFICCITSVSVVLNQVHFYFNVSYNIYKGVFILISGLTLPIISCFLNVNFYCISTDSARQ